MPVAHIVSAPIQGTVVSIDVRPGDVVRPGQQVAVLESMKMEHVVTAERSGVVEEVIVAIGTAVGQGEALLTLAPAAGAMATVGADDDAAVADAVARERISPQCSTATSALGTIIAPTRSRGVTARVAGPHGRTSPTCSTKDRSWSTGRSSSPRNAGVARSRS